MYFPDFHVVAGFSIPQGIEKAKFDDVIKILKIPSEYTLDVRAIRDPVSSLSMYNIHDGVGGGS